MPGGVDKIVLDDSQIKAPGSTQRVTEGLTRIKSGERVI
jgi:hypothetical protein